MKPEIRAAADKELPPDYAPADFGLLPGDGDEKGTEILSVYRTAGNRYALHTRSIPDWKLSWGDPEYVGNPKNWGLGNGLLQRLASWGYDWETFRESGNYILQVFDTLEELKPHVSDDLYKSVSQAMDEPEIEDLDI